MSEFSGQTTQLFDLMSTVNLPLALNTKDFI